MRSRARTRQRGWLAIGGCAVLVLGLGFDTACAQLEASQIDLDRAPFRPALIESNDPVCAGIEAFAVELFLTGESIEYVPRRAEFAGFDALRVYSDLQSEPRVVADPVSGEEIVLGARFFVTTYGRKVYLEDVVARRVQRQIFAGEIPPGLPGARDSASATPAAYAPQLLRRGDDRYYAAFVADGMLQLAHLSDAVRWDTVCRVLLEPGFGRPPREADGAVLGSLDALRETVEGLIRGAGSCGNRALGAFRQALDELVYRPRSPTYPERRRSDSYERDLRYLDTWARHGIDERRALDAFLLQFESTVAVLGEYYADAFGFAPAEAARWARHGLESAVSQGIWSGPATYGGSPFAGSVDAALRAAILNGDSVEVLRGFDVSLDAIDGNEGRGLARDESLLNVAVLHPEAVRYLLGLGANPNKANAFGKTPLMYAAQHNAIEAARLLLEAGADPNAATVFPEDTCNYTLSTADMTPLHYAVRYASRAFVELLLDNGAVTYIKTTRKPWVGPNEYPIEWVYRYNAPDAEERNPNTDDGELAALAALVAPPPADELEAIAVRYTLDAEAAYAAGDADEAYVLLRRALYASPANLRALGDMSLVATRAEEPGEAVGAALELLRLSDDPSVAATAWFNLGLACEPEDAWYDVRFDQTRPCLYSTVHPFLQAWRLAPSAARAEKLESLFSARTSCVDSTAAGGEVRYRATRYVNDRIPPVARVYVLHPPGTTLDTGAMRWQSAEAPEPIPPNFVERHELGARALSVFEGRSINGDLSIGDLPCPMLR